MVALRRATIPVVVGLLAALAAVGALGGSRGEANVRASLSRAVAGWQRRPTVVDLAELTPFRWTRVWAFGRSTSAETIDAALGQRWRVGAGEAPAASHVPGLLVFVDRGRVVREVAVGNSPGLDCIDGASFSARRARFLVTTGLVPPDGRLQPELVPEVPDASGQRLLVAGCRLQASEAWGL